MARSLLERLRILNEQMDGTLVMTKHGVFDHMIEYSPIGMFMCNLEGRFIFTNNVFEEVSGYDTHELMEMTVEQVVPDSVKDHALLRKTLMASMERRYLRVVHLKTKSGELAYVEVGLQPIIVNGGTRLCIGAVVPRPDYKE